MPHQDQFAVFTDAGKTRCPLVALPRVGGNPRHERCVTLTASYDSLLEWRPDRDEIILTSGLEIVDTIGIRDKSKDGPV